MSRTKSVTNIETKQGVKLSPQQILVASLLKANEEELQRLINEELEKNIVLESDESRNIDQMVDNDNAADDVENGDDDLQEIEKDDERIADEIDNYGDFDEEEVPIASQAEPRDYSPISNYGSNVSFRESLKEQLGMLSISERELFLANYIIDSLEDDGYLHRPLLELVDDLAWNQNFDTTEDELEKVLTEIVQPNVDPAGIGARNLRECLLLQLEDMSSSTAALNAYKVIEESFEDYKARRYDRIKTRYDFSDTEMADIQKVVHHLNPKPGGMSASTDALDSRAAQVRPDFIVSNEDGTLVVSLCNSHIPAVRISPDYSEMLLNIEKENAANADVQKGKAFLEDGIRAANLFINALVQRHNTLLGVMQTIVVIQSDYFRSGNIEDLKPMGLKDVAGKSGFDMSTISRVCNGRFVQADFGIFPLKELFTTAVSSGNDSKAVSNATIKNALKEIVDNEDKHNPLNDDELMKRLSALGYNIARRTVVKYRDALGIPKSNLRKK